LTDGDEGGGQVPLGSPHPDPAPGHRRTRDSVGPGPGAVVGAKGISGQVWSGTPAGPLPIGGGPGRGWSRRRVLAWALGGLGTVLLAGAGGVELALHDIVPGHAVLNVVDGNCAVPAVPESFSPLGPAQSGRIFSRARNRMVGYTIAYPPGHVPGARLPLVIALHGHGDDHTSVLSRLSLPQALALRIGGRPLAPMAMVAVDGGGGYWHAHPGDDPMAMIVDEVIPICRNLGLGRSPQRIGVIGTSMGGYGALLLAEQHPHLIAAAAAVSPAIWTSYAEARTANPGAFSSAADFAAHDVIAGARALTAVPVRMAFGHSDPFRSGVVSMIKHLPPGAMVTEAKGCHTAAFFAAQQPAMLSFLADRLTRD
jgi:pimeloyl-ACP methyl ester carboxylesterase